MITSSLWLPATLLAGATQAWRTAVQRRVSHSLSLNGAGMVRYLYGIPFALLLLGIYRLAFPVAWPALRSHFLLFCLAGGLAQIIATNLLILAFSHRNFV
ncbi:MAG TPA: EamA/RhaT family transporter, partial [Sphingobium sp.]|nr:EamA/RhaT family transporter [Sphingobium sp.]